MRCAPAKVSMPSIPPSLQRAAASAKSATTRAMSLSSISRAKARCRVSRTGDGPMGASAAPAYASARPPTWLTWHMRAAPWAWMRRAKR